MSTENPKLDIVVKNEEGKPVIVEVRTGAAVVLHPDTPIEFTGHLQAPGDWMENRLKLDLLDPKNCYLETNQDAGTIKFVVDYRNKFKDFLVGTLVESKVIKNFKINIPELIEDKPLAKFFRQNAFYFENQDLNKSIVEKLMSFTAKVDRKIQNDQDLKGNKKLAYEQAVHTDVPPSFVMKAPLFDGYPDETFTVFINGECESVGVKFYLESVDLFRMIEERKRALISEQVKRFEVFGCAIITK